MIATLGIITAVILIVFQLLWGFVAYWRSRNLAGRYNAKLIAGGTLIDLLETYITVFESINVRVDAPIRVPALFRYDILLVNKTYARTSNLYSAFVVVWQVLLGKEHNKYLRQYKVSQNLLWLLEVALFVLAVLFDPAWLILCIPLGVGLIAHSIFLYIIYGELVLEVLDTLYVLGEFAPQERAYLRELGGLIREEVFKYPATLLVSAVQFILPIRRSIP